MRRLREYAEAEEQLQASLRTYESHLGSTALRTLDAREHLAQLYDAWGRPMDAARQRNASVD